MPVAQLMRVSSGRTILRHPGLLVPRREYVFVVGHMRSYSSVLCHVLGSHREISGYAEMQVAYRGPLDLLRLRVRVAESLGASPATRLVLDKILHDPYAVMPSMLAARSSINPIFLVRRPAAALPSIVRMARDLGYDDWTDSTGATAYYVRRLAGLERLGRLCRRPALVLRAEDLLEDTTTTLDAIAQFLHLREPLSRSYSIFPETGVAARGDISEALKSGELHDAPAKALPTAIPSELLAEAEASYAVCLATLTRLFGEASAPGAREPTWEPVRS
jgi:hypothetical protein